MVFTVPAEGAIIQTRYVVVPLSFPPHKRPRHDRENWHKQTVGCASRFHWGAIHTTKVDKWKTCFSLPRKSHKPASIRASRASLSELGSSSPRFMATAGRNKAVWSLSHFCSVCPSGTVFCGSPPHLGRMRCQVKKRCREPSQCSADCVTSALPRTC